MFQLWIWKFLALAIFCLLVIFLGSLFYFIFHLFINLFFLQILEMQSPFSEYSTKFWLFVEVKFFFFFDFICLVFTDFFVLSFFFLIAFITLIFNSLFFFFLCVAILLLYVKFVIFLFFYVFVLDYIYVCLSFFFSVIYQSFFFDYNFFTQKYLGFFLVKDFVFCNFFQVFFFSTIIYFCFFFFFRVFYFGGFFIADIFVLMSVILENLQGVKGSGIVAFFVLSIFCVFDNLHMLFHVLQIIAVLVLSSFVPLFFLKLFIVFALKFYIFLVTLLWVFLNFLKFLFINLFQSVRVFDSKNKIFGEISLDNMTDDENATGGSHFAGNELFGDRTQVYEQKKKRKFKRIFLLNSFYFLKPAKEKKSATGADERPHLNLNNFIWTRSFVFNRPMQYISHLRLKKQNYYDVMKTSMLYKTFFHFLHKAQKHPVNFFSDNFFHFKFKRDFKNIILSKYTLSGFERENVSGDEQVLSEDLRYSEDILKNLKKFYLKKKVEHEHFFLSVGTENSILAIFQGLQRKVVVFFLGFVKEFLLSLSDLNRITLYFVIKSTLSLYISTIFFYVNFNFILYYFLFCAFVINFIIYEERMDGYLHFKDFFDLPRKFPTLCNKMFLLFSLRPKSFYFSFVSFLKTPYFFFIFLNKKKWLIFFFLIFFFKILLNYVVEQ